LTGLDFHWYQIISFIDDNINFVAGGVPPEVNCVFLAAVHVVFK
jgi:hypothetical protein